MTSMSRVLALVAVLSLAGTPVVAQPAQHLDGPQKAAPPDPVGTFADGFSPSWIEDADFVYGPALLDFDVSAYLAASAPHLVAHAEVISHWSGYYSISPKVLLAILDMQSGVVSGAPAATAMINPSGGLVAGADMDTQVRTLLMSLYVDFYAFREASRSRSTSMNAGTFALLNLFHSAAPTGLTPSTADDARRRFLEAHARLFPASALAAVADVTPNAVPPPDFLQFPWKHNQAWFFNGVHTQTGNDPGVMSSIDFVRTWSLQWGANTSTDYVVATHAGTVTVFSSCNVRVTAPNGWSTTYYHLSNVIVASGATVNANDTIGVYANTLQQALCQGGSSTGPHVHFSLLQNGVYSPLDGVRLSDYVVHSGRYSYDSDANYMWLASATTGTRYYAYQTALVSTPTSSGLPNAPTNLTASLNGLTVSMHWTAPSGGSAPSDYVVDAAVSSSFSPVLVGPLAVGSATSTALTAPPGTLGTFYLRVAGRNASGTGAPSNIVSVTFTPGSSAPGAPGTPVVQVTASRSIIVSWSAPTTGPAPTAYRAYVNLGGVPLPGSPFALPAVTAVASPPLPPGAYALAVSAVAGAIEGPLSSAAAFVIPGACTAAPQAPSGFGITKLGGVNARLVWSAPAGPNTAASYRLQAALDASFAAVVLDVNVGNITILDAVGAPGTFHVRVFAVNDCGTGPPSGTAVVTLP